MTMTLIDGYRVRLAGATTAALVERFNLEAGKPGWASARAAYLMALREALEVRQVDLRAVQAPGGGFDLTRRVRLVGRSLVHQV